MGNGNNPNPVWLLQINNAERKPLHLPTARAEFPRLAEFGIGLDFCQCLPGGIEEAFPKKFASAFVKTRRLDEFIFGEPMINNGFHAMRAGLSSSLLRPEFLWLFQI